MKCLRARRRKQSNCQNCTTDRCISKTWNWLAIRVLGWLVCVVVCVRDCFSDGVKWLGMGLSGRCSWFIITDPALKFFTRSCRGFLDCARYSRMGRLTRSKYPWPWSSAAQRSIQISVLPIRLFQTVHVTLTSKTPTRYFSESLKYSHLLSPTDNNTSPI